MDTFPAHQTVNRLDIFLLPFRINIFQPHRAGGITRPAFRTGRAIFFQLKNVKFIKYPQQIPHRTHNAPETPDEEAAHQKRYCQYPAKHKVDPVPAKGRRKYLIRAYITEVAARKGKTQKQKNPRPF